MPSETATGVSTSALWRVGTSGQERRRLVQRGSLRPRPSASLGRSCLPTARKAGSSGGMGAPLLLRGAPCLAGPRSDARGHERRVSHRGEPLGQPHAADLPDQIAPREPPRGLLGRRPRHALGPRRASAGTLGGYAWRLRFAVAPRALLERRGLRLRSAVTLGRRAQPAAAQAASTCRGCSRARHSADGCSTFC